MPEQSSSLMAPDAVRAVLEVAKSFAMAVASTHATFVDTEMLVRLAGSVGLERLVVTNPAARFGADEATQLLSHDLYVELPFLSYYPGSGGRKPPARGYRQVRGRPVYRLDGLRPVDEPSPSRGDADGHRGDDRRGNA